MSLKQHFEYPSCECVHSVPSKVKCKAIEHFSHNLAGEVKHESNRLRSPAHKRKKHTNRKISTMSDTTICHTALDFNVKAVSLLALGDHRGCTLELENGLKAYRGFLRNNDVRMAEGPEDHLGGPTIRILSIPLPDSVSEHTPVAPNKMSTPSEFAGGNLITVFQKAFVAVLEEEQVLASVPEHIVPAIILYNMGLSFHLDAIRKGSTIVMARAYEFYRHSMALVEHRRVEMDPSRQRPLLAALALNMAHISAAFYHDVDTRRSMVLLSNLIADVGNAHEDLEEDELDTFTMSWIFYSEYHHLALAAAA
jgi:hypothetical protein